MRLNFDELATLKALPIFDESVVDFLDSLSRKLITAREFPDVVTFGFWCRKANILKLKAGYPENNRLGRGVVFHIAPSNVAVNFAYSFVVALLAGNANIVRLPSKDFPQVDIICNAVGENERVKFVHYGHEKEVTDYLSSLCMSRIIWGGDSTINEIRKSPIPPRANEITFPDRFSACVINADKYLSDYDKAKIVKDFFNDTYLTDQNACTSPRIVFWLGEKREQAKHEFWSALAETLNAYDLQAVQSVNKLTTFYEYSAENSAKLLTSGDNKIVRVSASVTPNILDHLDNSGYFYECDIESIADILPICTQKLQTLSYIGFDAIEIRDVILANAPNGVDRIVLVGKTMDFSLVWDGIDLIRTLSRSVTL